MAAPLSLAARRWLRWPLVHWMDRRLAFPDLSGEPDVGFLADDSRHFEVFAGWLHAQWSAPRGESLSHRREMLREQMNLDRLPIALIAYWRGSPAGIVSLRTDDLRSRPDRGPWLSALYVDVPYRGRGIGRVLTHAVVELAGWLGYPEVYLFTTDRQDFYAALGWRRLPRLSEEAARTPPPDVFSIRTR